MSLECKFKEHSVVPDVIDVAPTTQADVNYPSGAKAELGKVLTPTQVKDEPTVSWPVEEGALYTLIMTDPDAPSRRDPKWSEWRHWLVVNIPASVVALGEKISTYVGAGPPEGTGLHRYVFLVYKQPGHLTCDEPRQEMTAKGRNNWKAMDFTKKYNLGNPIAGNFFQAEWDDYVPKLYAQLK